ncbi:hypothetical protein LguiA_007118 [Lonicera macranthoides]
MVVTRSNRKLLESRLSKADVSGATISDDNFSLLRRLEINGSYKPEEIHTLGDSHTPEEEYSLEDCMTILKSMNLSGRQFKLAKAKFEEHIYWRIFFLVVTPENRLDWATKIS